MLKLRLGSDESFLILAPRGADLGPVGQIAVIALLLLVPLGLIVWLYRYELRLVAGWQAAGLFTLRILILLVLWLAVGLQPRLADIHVEETPSRVRVAVDLSSSMDVVDRDQSVSRRALVEEILSPTGKNLLRRLAEKHQVEIVGFHQDAFELQPTHLLERLNVEKNQADIVATNLQLPLAKASSRRDNPLLGIVLFSDGQHNLGPPPLLRVKELAEEEVPIYPVVVGSKNPPSDWMIVEVQAPTKAFKDTTIAIKVGAKVTNLPPQELILEMLLDGQPARPEHRHIIKHEGKNHSPDVTFLAKMDVVGTRLIEIKATSQKGKEITLANNHAMRFLRVAEEKIKVLLIDGEARWEYHYLAVALLRDPAISLERVVFNQPRVGAIKAAELEKAGLAKSKLPEPKKDEPNRDPLLDYDCILLGDVSPEEMPIADRRRLEKYVAERGGTLVMLAGKRYQPMAYGNALSPKVEEEPFLKMLPITEPRELKKEAGFTLRPSVEGKLRPFLQFDPDKPASAWPELPTHFWGVTGKRKPAASILLTHVDEKPDAAVKDDEKGILLEHNYGFGRVIFVGIDSTWRWRFRVGDTYHHRFWGQLARWSAADKLLPAGNRFVRYGSREPVVTTGQEVELAIRLSETLPPLKDIKDVRMKLHRKKSNGAEELIAVIPLALHPRQPNVLEAKVRDLAAGTYRLELDIPQYAAEIAMPADEKDLAVQGRDLVRVLPLQQKELLDLSTNWAVMESLAAASGGKVYTPETVEEILARLERRIQRTEHKAEQYPWKDEPMVWWMLTILITLLTMEWAWRRWLELA